MNTVRSKPEERPERQHDIRSADKSPRAPFWKTLTTWKRPPSPAANDSDAGSPRRGAGSASEDQPELQKWSPEHQPAMTGEPRRHLARAQRRRGPHPELVEARKLLIAIGAGLLVALSLSLAAAWAPEDTNGQPRIHPAASPTSSSATHGFS